MTKKDMLMDNAEAEAREKAKEKAVVDEAHENRIAWWREARFGMFIHWGLYSIPAGIWKGEAKGSSYGEQIQLHAKIPIKEYELLAKEFNPVKFDAEEWVKIAKDTGMKYIVITAKHHDGFAMYDSKVSDFNIVKATPFGRDPMKELEEACKKEGIKLCFYYSHSMDWHHPDSQGNILDFPGNIGAWDPPESWIHDEDKRTRYERYLEEKAYPQVKELLTQYGPVGTIWFDCGHKLTDEQGFKFINLVHGTQPGCLVNRRVRREPLGDYGNTGDNQVAVRPPRRDWESLATLNDSWGYKKNDHNWKSVEDVLKNLIDVASMNGNFLLNVGPTGEGEIDPVSLGLLDGIGKWMRRNSESIYDSSASPIGIPPWGRCTANRNINKLYLHVFEWPSSGELIVPGLRNKVKTVYLVADPDKKPMKHVRLDEQDVLISVPEKPDEIFPVIVVEYEGVIDANPMMRLAAKDYNNVFRAFDGVIHGSTLRYDVGKKGKDGVLDWTNPEDWISWDFRVSDPGEYRLEMNYGAIPEAEGNTYCVTVGDASIKAEVNNTGNQYKFETYPIGTVNIPSAGVYTISVKPDTIKGGALMYLRSVVLKAADCI